MQNYTKPDGAIVVKDANGKIVTNLSGQVLAGGGPAVTVSLDLARNAEHIADLNQEAEGARHAFLCEAAKLENESLIAEHRDVIAEESGEYEAMMYEYALDQTAEATPGAGAEARHETAERVAMMLGEEYFVSHGDRGWDVRNVPGFMDAAQAWNVEAIDQCVDEAVYEYALEFGNDREDYAVHEICESLDCSVESALVVYGETKSAFGDNWTYSESEFYQTTSRVYGLVDREKREVRECVEALRRCADRGVEGELVVDSLDELDKVTALLPEAGINSEFPRSVVLTQRGRDEVQAWLAAEGVPGFVADEVRARLLV